MESNSLIKLKNAEKQLGKKRIMSALSIILIITSIYVLQTQIVAAQNDNVQVNVDLFPLSREIKQGDGVRAVIRIDTNKNEIIDVIIRYTITNNGGIEVFQKSKTLAVERTAKVSDHLMIHRTLDPGPYLVDVDISYENTRKTERDTFEVVGETVALAFGYRELTFLLIISLIIFLIILWVKNKRSKNE